MAGRTQTVVKSRYVARGSGRTTPRTHRGKAGLGARRAIGSALRYIETRPLGPDETAVERRLFSRDAEEVAQAEARERLAGLATRRVAYHSLIFSPGPGAERLSNAVLQEWTRQVLADLEAQRGYVLTWYAVVHRNTDHPHVHVIIGAATRDAQERWASVRLTRDDFMLLRESGDRHHAELQQSSAVWRDVAIYLRAAAGELLTLTSRTLGSGDSGGRTDRAEIERDDCTRER